MRRIKTLIYQEWSGDNVRYPWSCELILRPVLPLGELLIKNKTSRASVPQDRKLSASSLIPSHSLNQAVGTQPDNHPCAISAPSNSESGLFSSSSTLSAYAKVKNPFWIANLGVKGRGRPRRVRLRPKDHWYWKGRSNSTSSGRTRTKEKVSRKQGRTEIKKQSHFEILTKVRRTQHQVIRESN